MDYRNLLRARQLSKIFSKRPEYPTYEKALSLVKKYDDLDVWCSSLLLFIVDWNWVYFKDKDDIEGFATELYKALRDTKETLHKIRQLKLILLNENQLENLEPTIQVLYERFKGILGDTGASKALHALCPDFFIMWDANIREGYGLDDYSSFLLKMRKEIEEAIISYGKDKGIKDFSRACKTLEQELEKVS